MILAPRSEEEAATLIQEARQQGRTLSLQGNGTQAGFGRPVSCDLTLSARALDGITLHEPSELVISARAGTPLRVVEEKLAAAGQMLPFEPLDLRPLYGTGGEPTVGGVAATNASGPRRIAAGAARDHIIGVRFINGRGEAIKSGGRVMKNVTGLDLVKLQCGAHGTLGFLTEVTFKVLPKTETAATLVFRGLDDSRGVALLTEALCSPFEVSGAAHLPPGIEATGARTLLRLENFARSVAYRSERLAELLRRYGEPERLDEAATRLLWAKVRDAQFFAGQSEEAVWRLSVPPAQGAEVVARLRQRLSFRHFYDWGGGLIWLATEASGDAGAMDLREALLPFGGHATLLRAPDSVRLDVAVFQPLSAPLEALSRRVRQSLDPDLILNRGRMIAEA